MSNSLHQILEAIKKRWINGKELHFFPQLGKFNGVEIVQISDDIHDQDIHWHNYIIVKYNNSYYELIASFNSYNNFCELDIISEMKPVKKTITDYESI